jgi:hypothetical protein
LSLGIEDSEIPIILAAAEQVLGEESEARQELVRGLLSGEGEFQGVSRESSYLPQIIRTHHSLDLTDKTHDLLIWGTLLRIHAPNQALLLLKSLVLWRQYHQRRNPVLL